ncbi:MAG: methyltransferase domain-containing protein [Solirubrobacterales bacterium]|nr:methyltransferase domain-containing protein [Solirubrobacterales bacterium]
MDHLRSTLDPASYYAVDEDGSRRRLPIGRWLKRAHDDEEILLERAVGPVLDIGCGAGRHLAALGRRGIEATGVEVSRFAVALAREQHANVIHGSVFDLTESQKWHTALLLDGNVGIGGDPERLLAQSIDLLRPNGQVLVELEPPSVETRSVNLRLEGPSDVSEWFPWAWVGVDSIASIARSAGLEVSDVWSSGDRWFSQLRLVSMA